MKDRLEKISIDHKDEKNNIILMSPAHEKGFSNVFINEKQWYYVKIDKWKIDILKYIISYVIKNCFDDLEFLQNREIDDEKNLPQIQRNEKSLIEKIQNVFGVN